MSDELRPEISTFFPHKKDVPSSHPTAKPGHVTVSDQYLSSIPEAPVALGLLETSLMTFLPVLLSVLEEHPVFSNATVVPSWCPMVHLMFKINI